jgi:hypothetical protein
VAVSLVLQVAQRAILDPKKALGMWEEHPAGNCQLHLSRIPLEELNAELFLQGLNSQRKAGLRQIEARRGPPEMALRGGGDEGL